MPSIESPLVLTKLRVPTLRSRLIARPRLVEELFYHPDKNFILLSAPAGYGKTTLLVNWTDRLKEQGVLVAWYALDAGDDDPLSFGSYLVGSLLGALGANSDLAHTAQVLRSLPEYSLQKAVQAVINAIALVEHVCVLILDDYHLITSPAIHTAVAFLLEHLPENLRVVIGSRADPPFPLARMRVRGKMLEIRAADLRFTAEESARFLNEVMRLEISPQGIVALEARTEGWVAGLQLAALSLSGRVDKEDYLHSFTGSHHYLVAYLLEEVVSRQSQETQSFLVATSILERMCAPLCEALFTGDCHGDSILQQLDQANLFVVALDDERHWYRYHHLFRDFLRARLEKQQPEIIPWLHRQASEWLAAQGLLREAAQHAFQLQDWEYAAAFVEKHSFTMIIRSEMAVIYTWCSAFPEEVMQAHPLLCLMQCWGLVFSFNQQNRPKSTLRLQQVQRAIEKIEDPQMVEELREHLAVLQSFLAMTPDRAADPHVLLAQSRLLVQAYSDGSPGQFSGLLSTGYACMAFQDGAAAEENLAKARQAALLGGMFFGVIESTFQLARLAHNQGKLQRVVQICQQGRSDVAKMLGDSGQTLPALGCLDIALGWVWLEQNRLAEAEELLLRGLQLVGTGTNHYYLMTAYIGLARLYEITRQPAQALRYLSQLEELWPDIAFFIQGLRVLLGLRGTGERAAAQSWCQKMADELDGDFPPPGMGPYGAAEIFYRACLTWIEIQILIGKGQVARPLLDKMLATAAQYALHQREIDLLVLLALGEFSQGHQLSAIRSLEKALTLAQPEGMSQVFDRGAALNQLLHAAAQAGIHPEYIARIFSMLRAPEETAAVPNKPGLVEALSQREIEVVQCMAWGASNQAIAERLVISVGTVKSHINHILGKLGARNRTEAVAKARELELI